MSDTNFQIQNNIFIPNSSDYDTYDLLEDEKIPSFTKTKGIYFQLNID